MASEKQVESNLNNEENDTKDFIELEMSYNLYEMLTSGTCDMQTMCRICFSTSNTVLYPLWAKDSILQDMLTSFTSLQLLAEDNLPPNLCEECQAQVVQCYDFKLKCERANYLLKSVLNGNFIPKDYLLKVRKDEGNLEAKDDMKTEIDVDFENGCEVHEAQDLQYIDAIEEKNGLDDALYIVQTTKRKRKKTQNLVAESDVHINKAIKEKSILRKKKGKGKKFMCNLCSKVFLKEKTFRTHIETQHLNDDKPPSPLPYPCTQCKQAFDSEHDLSVHSVIHCKVVGSVYKCHKCFKEFENNSAFRRHIQRHMKSKRYACEACSKSFTELYALRRHTRVHTGEIVPKKHKCHLCDKRYSESSQLAVHISRHIGLRPWECRECAKTFPSERLLTSHRLVHSDRKPYACSYCDRRFRHESTRNTHHRTHTGEKPYICSVCGKSFIQNSNLTLHMRTHTGERPYSCDVCARRFKSGSSLKSHERVHTGERPYSCPVCGKSFARRNMAAHLRAHSGERPFACSVCPKRFVSNSRLREHFRIHTGEKPYECASCTQTFATKSHLVKHLKVHQTPATKKNTALKKLPLKKPTENRDSVFIMTPVEVSHSPTKTVIVNNGVISETNEKDIPLNMDIPLELSGELVLHDNNSRGVIVVGDDTQNKDNLCLPATNVDIISSGEYTRDAGLMTMNEGEVNIASTNIEGATVKLYQLDQSLVQIHSAGGQVTISKITSKMTANF